MQRQAGKGLRKYIPDFAGRGSLHRTAIYLLYAEQQDSVSDDFEESKSLRTCRVKDCRLDYPGNDGTPGGPSSGPIAGGNFPARLDRVRTTRVQLHIDRAVPARTIEQLPILLPLSHHKPLRSGDG